jgi:hypothetical protein
MGARRIGRTRVWLAVGLFWLGGLSWAPPASATTPTPLMSCCGGSACCGGRGWFGTPCQLAYGAAGTVTDARTGAPIVGARVTAAGIETLSTEDGSYGAFGSRPDTCHLDYYVPVSAQAHGYAPFGDALYTSVPVRHLDIRLEPLDTGTGYTINGVVAESPPCEGSVNGVTVILEPLGRRTETATVGLATGFFEFADVPPGEYTVRAEPTCTLYGCWEPRSVSVSMFDVGASLCPTLPADAARLSIGHVTGAPGDTVAIDFVLHAADAAPTGVTSTISFEPEAAIAAAADGGPDCELVADVEAASFGWLPAGCTAGADCTALRAEVQIGAAPPPDDAVLFRCRAAITDQPADRCYHRLRCLDLTISGGGAPLDAMCEHGSVTSEMPQPGLQYHFAVIPEQPVVGDPVEVRVAVSGSGGLPNFRLLGAQPLLSGETFVTGSGPVTQTVTFHLDAVGSGNARLSLSVTYEALFGCPGSTGYRFVGDTSGPFLLEIAPGGAPTPTATPDEPATPTPINTVTSPPDVPAPTSPTANHGLTGGGSCAIQPPAGGDGLGLVLGALVLLACRHRRRPSGLLGGLLPL